MMTNGDGALPDPAMEDTNAEAAIDEEQKYGETSRRCLRCGGRFIFDDCGTAYVIRCENGDYKLTARGI